MTRNEFLMQYNLTSWNESDRLEWKQSTREVKQIVCSAVAFANTAGGVVVAGVKDDGEVVGQDISDATLREVSQTILANTDERIFPQVERIILEGKDVLVVSITESPLKPHVAYGRPYVRVGSTNSVMTQGEYRLALGQKRNGYGIDREAENRASLADLDLDLLERFLDQANTRRNTTFPVFAEPKSALESLELLNDGVLTKGALLCFGKSPQKFLPQAQIRAGFFPDSRKMAFIDQKIFEGNLFSQLEAAMSFVKTHLQLKVDPSKVMDRTELALPPAAVQELLANALVHRDYRDGAAIYLNIFRGGDLEVVNPGVFPQPRITVDNLSRPHPSLPLNRRLARVFFLAGIIEQWGLGTLRVYELCRQHGLPEPKWCSENGSITAGMTASLLQDQPSTLTVSEI